MIGSLGVVFDRMPKYAWIMKQMLEPERSITFRVPWIDDSGISRLNRGFRCQFSSALGPYVGGTAFSFRMNMSLMKSAAFDTTFSNALSGQKIGGAYGGADFNPYNKSETEIQRFCQSYMTELSKYIGPEVDLPGLGEGVSATEIGYMYGQYKRINHHCGQFGQGLLWGGNPVHMQAQGHGVVFFAKKMLEEKGQTLEGKRCLITGSSYVAMAVAEKLLQYGAVPITFSDPAGHVYEPQGIDAAKVRTIQKIKSERGAHIGRYIIASTTAKYNEPANVFDIPCDLVFPCQNRIAVTDDDIVALNNNGCQGVIEGVQQSITNAALAAAKKRGMIHGPYRATTVAGAIFNGLSIASVPLNIAAGDTVDKRIEDTMCEVYDEVKRTAKEFNTRGDLNAGANIASFLRIADVMQVHGHFFFNK